MAINEVCSKPTFTSIPITCVCVEGTVQGGISHFGYENVAQIIYINIYPHKSRPVRNEKVTRGSFY